MLATKTLNPQTDVTNLFTPARLSNSTFLRDLSLVSGSDLVGRDGTAQSLGLASTYTVSLLTSCAVGVPPRLDTVCRPPALGFRFDPAVDVDLQRTSLAGSFPPDLTAALDAYHGVSGFLAFAYVASAALVVLAPVLALFAGRIRILGTVGSAFAGVATLLLLAASIASVVVFSRVRDALNSAFSGAGIATSLGWRLFVLSFAASLLALSTAIILSLRAGRDAAQRRTRGGMGPSLLDKSGGGAMITGEPVPDGAGGPRPAMPGLLGRIPTWSRHRYVQVEKQPAVARGGAGVPGEAGVLMDASRDVPRGGGGQQDDFSADYDDYAHPDFDGRNSAQHQRGIAMMPLVGASKTKDMDTAYEPYKSTAAQGQ